MDLCTVTVTAFRRFKTRSTLKTNGKLVAILGPNEAGKSSLLSAIALLGHDKVLGFQFVPGLSYAQDEGFIHAPAIGRDSGILYLVDGDKDGAEIARRLNKKGVNKDDIFTLKNKDGSAVEVEDFVEKDLIVEAANVVIQKYHPKSQKLNLKDIPDSKPMAALEAAFKANARQSLRKVELAYEILDVLSEDPSRNLLSKKRLGAFRMIASAMLARLEARTRPVGYA